MAHGETDRFVHTYRRARDNYVLVFALIIGAVVMHSLVDGAGLGGLLVTGVEAAALLLAIRTTGVRGRLLVFLRVLAFIPVLAVLVAIVTGYQPAILYLGSTTLLVISTMVAILVREVRKGSITIDTVMAALCVYVLAGLLFAALDALYAALFVPFFAQPVPPTAGNYLYFSFITMCTVGYGDLTPGPPGARVLAVAEALTGQLYLVTVIALLVGNLGAQRLASKQAEKR